MKTYDPFQIGLSAMSNCSRAPVELSDLLPILASGDGPAHLTRALFEDCSFDSLDSMAMAAGLSPAQLRAAYAVARERHGVRNADLEEDELLIPPKRGA